MNENLLYCIIGIVGGGMFSILVSAFFYYVGFLSKCLLVDLFATGYKTDESHDFVFTMRNIGKFPIDMSDFIKANKPALSINNIQSYSAIPSSYANCVKPKIRQSKNRLCISFDYLKPKEQIIIVILGDKSIEKFYGLLKDGKIISYQSVMNFAKRKRKFSILGVLILECFAFSTRLIPIIVVVNLFIGFDIVLDCLYLWTFRKRKENLQWISIVKGENASFSTK